MAYAQFLAGMAFNNASLGFVLQAHVQLGGFFGLDGIERVHRTGRARAWENSSQ